MHYKTRPRNELNARQRQVMDLIAQGLTNAQIAEALDISLNGAKWHVSEILAACDFESRDEAARYWRHEHGLVRRFQRATRAIFAPVLLHPIVAGVATLAVGAIAAAGVYAFAHTGSSPAPSLSTAPPVVATVAAPLTGPVVQDPSISQIQMVDRTSGWAFEGAATATKSGNFALRTDDAARTWHATAHPWADDAGLASGTALDLQHAWVVTSTAAAVPTPGTYSETLSVWRTSDGGQTWKSAMVPEGGPSEITFIDPKHGWMLQGLGAGAGSEGVAILRTTDGGATWSEAAVTASTPGAPPLQCSKSGISFVTPFDGWVTGDCAGGAPYLYASHDGGTTWTRVALPSLADPASDIVQCLCNVTAPVFPTARDGYFVLSGEQTAVYATHDAGSTWTPLPGPVVPSPLLSNAVFANATDGWVSNRDALYATHDGAVSWSNLTTNLPLENSPVLDFVSASDGWAAVNADTGIQVWHTTDGGVTWATGSTASAASPTP